MKFIFVFYKAKPTHDPMELLSGTMESPQMMTLSDARQGRDFEEPLKGASSNSTMMKCKVSSVFESCWLYTLEVC